MTNHFSRKQSSNNSYGSNHRGLSFEGGLDIYAVTMEVTFDFTDHRYISRVVGGSSTTTTTTTNWLSPSPKHIPYQSTLSFFSLSSSSSIFYASKSDGGRKAEKLLKSGHQLSWKTTIKYINKFFERIFTTSWAIHF